MDGGIFLLLGSNLGDRLMNLEEASTQVGGVIASSSVYVTAAWGNENQEDFLNQAIEIDSPLSPYELLTRVQDIELGMGRKRVEKWGPRLIDIDILFYRDDVIKASNLIVPHPGIQDR